MPVLDNARHERFAQEIAKGKTATEAYEIAGYKPDDGNASKLAARSEITGRIQEITGKAAKDAGVTAERIIAELAKIGFSNMQDFITVGTDGLPYCDFSNLTRDQAAAISEVNVETGTVFEINEAGEREGVPVRKVRFKLSDKRAALGDLAKIIGIAKDQVEHSGSIETVVVSDFDLARWIAHKLEAGIQPGTAAIPPLANGHSEPTQ